MQTERENRNERIAQALKLVEGLRKGACPCGYMGTIVSGKCFKCGADWGIGPVVGGRERGEEGSVRGMLPNQGWSEGKGDSASGSPQRAASGPIREALAALCHEQWSGWMKYLFEKCEDIPHPDSDAGETAVTIPAQLVYRWGRQLQTPYERLSEEEKDSDRAEADRFLALLGEAPPTSGEVEQSPNHGEMK